MSNMSEQSHLKPLFKITCIGLITLIGATIVFAAGFGSAYLLTQVGILPVTAPASDEQTQLPATPTPEWSTENPWPGGTPTPMAIPTPQTDDEREFQIFWEAWDLIQRNFYGPLPDMQTVSYAAIHGVLEELGDPYTAFIEPEPAAILSEDASGEFEGIGAYVNMTEEGALEISGVFEGGPAEQAGIQEGDRVLAVDGVDISGMTLYEAIGLIRGPSGTQVTLLIMREGIEEPFEVVVTRARLEIPIIEIEMRDDGVGYIRLYEFSANAREQMEGGLKELLAQDPVGIVFDLRMNPGGWLDQAIEVADLFLDDGTVLIERWSDGREEFLPRGGVRDGDIGEEIPLVVLVDRGTASASEIVAGALQDHERAILIGEVTFGKGSVQRPFTLSDGSELRVTIAHWFTPDDQEIHGHGLEPNIEVPWPEEETEDDPQLERAVEYILTGE